MAQTQSSFNRLKHLLKTIKNKSLSCKNFVLPGHGTTKQHAKYQEDGHILKKLPNNLLLLPKNG